MCTFSVHQAKANAGDEEKRSQGLEECETAKKKQRKVPTEIWVATLIATLKAGLPDWYRAHNTTMLLV